MLHHGELSRARIPHGLVPLHHLQERWFPLVIFLVRLDLRFPVLLHFRGILFRHCIVTIKFLLLSLGFFIQVRYVVNVAVTWRRLDDV